MRRLFGASVSLVVALVVSALAQAPAFAQGFGALRQTQGVPSPSRDGAGPEAPSFRAGTTLVEFTVVVTGEDGRHVTDLKQEDISIVEAGRPREVAFFHYEGTRSESRRLTM